MSLHWFIDNGFQCISRGGGLTSVVIYSDLFWNEPVADVFIVSNQTYSTKADDKIDAIDTVFIAIIEQRKGSCSDFFLGIKHWNGWSGEIFPLVACISYLTCMRNSFLAIFDS